MQDYKLDFDGLTREELPALDMLSALFEARGWHCERDSEDEVCAEYKGSWTSYQLRAVCRDQDSALQILALPEISVPEDKRTAIYTALGLINEQIWLGHFDLWANTGLLAFRQAILLPGNGMLGLDQAQTLIDVAIDECERFYPVFQFIIWGDKSPEDAIASALIETQGEA